jgi:hypothetical protein
MEIQQDGQGGCIMNDRPQLHISMLDMASRCWIQFVRRWGFLFDIWEKEEIVPPGVAAITGIGAHRGAQFINTDKMNLCEDRPLNEYQSIGSDEVKARWSKGVHFMGSKTEFAEAKGVAIDKAVNFIGLYHQHVRPDIEPILVEHPFVIKLPDQKFDLAGRIDVVEKLMIVDYKTGSVSPPEYAAQSPQMAMYSHWFHKEYKRFPELVCIASTYATKTKTGHNYHYKTRTASPSPAWVQPLYGRILTLSKILEACQKGLVDPLTACPAADPSGWICTAKYCGYAGTCGSWSGRK